MLRAQVRRYPLVPSRRLMADFSALRTTGNSSMTLPIKPRGCFTLPFEESTLVPVALTGPYSSHTLSITYTNDASVADAFVDAHATAVGDIGFDLEHRPCFRPGSKPNVSLMQFAPLSLGTSHPVLVFSLYHNSGQLPRKLQDILRDPSIRKHGVGIKSDLQHLKYLDLQEASRASFMELGPLALACGMADRKGVGLKALIDSCLGEPCTAYKTKKTTMTNWEIQDLNEKQLQYAAMDAFTGVEIYRLLDEKRCQDKLQKESIPLQSETEHHHKQLTSEI